MNYRSTPPVRFSQCVPPGLIGYKERKRDQQKRAHRDRQALVALAASDRSRAFLIENLSKAFPLLNVWSIAEAVIPWDPKAFKENVTAAQARYLVENFYSG